MKKKIGFSILAIIFLTVGFAAWKFLGPTVHIPKKKYFFISTGESYDRVKADLVDLKIISGGQWFEWASKMIGYEKVRPGRYEITKGMSLVNLARKLKNGQQTPVNFVITKLRTRKTQ